MGKHEFTFESDEKCTNSKNFTKQILLTTCPEEEFTCGDGHCISMEKRCDKIIDCVTDSADEENCNIVQFDPTYKREFAPVQVEDNGKIVKTSVNVSLDLLNILKISEVKSLFSCQIRLILSWRDHRLQFTNLKPEANLNSLPLEEKGTIWTPLIVFTNTELRDRVKNDKKASVTIKRLGKFVAANDDTLDNTVIYEGSENPITLSRSYKSKLHSYKIPNFILLNKA